MTTENYDFASNIDMAKAMNRMNDIVRVIAEKQDVEVCKAFTISITKFLRKNGIVPIMTQTEPKFETQYDKDRVVLKKSFGVCFNELDTSEHDAKVRADVIEEVFGKIEERLNDSTTVTFDLPVEDVLGDNVDMDDFLMLAEEIVQEYKDLIFSKLAQAKKQLKEKNNG